ncbi:DUF302 domain-containing protein [Rubrimonas cliftonensis]|uniref:Uncharacterized conserved protein, DUF302 family n=1 Tax=Rubrimonas cliftonensis TaxID=89524 RepID=A0A1H4DF40_9RHOB|nr:DUF302 domain-containing protein [Rubrimonas cliftonensis]SEA71463.1 Uncharacterized conserved protein, DUF302 family [Rubrimonas cliftonensis]
MVCWHHRRHVRLTAAAAAALAASFCGGLAGAAAAETGVSYETDAAFDDVAFAVEQAIVGRGLVVDHVSHVGEMLERTRADVGSDVKLFEAADVYVFCSAVVSRQVMEADPANIAHCPYGVYVASAGPDGPTTVGYRTYPEGPMQIVQSLLDEIAREAAGLD